MGGEGFIFLVLFEKHSDDMDKKVQEKKQVGEPGLNLPLGIQSQGPGT